MRMKNATMLFFVVATLLGSAIAELAVCTEDHDEDFVLMMNRTGQWESGITSCVDAPSCDAEIASLCCEHCKPNNVTLEMPWVDDADPVQVYMSLGQSNCQGSASADLMKADGAHPELFENDTTKSKVWFAGLTSKLHDDSFGITALWAGCAGSKHGPELAFGHRLQELTGQRVLIFKYCLGGTSAKEDWNPDWHGNSMSDGNHWNKTEDNMTAAFLKDLRMGNPKQQQYLQFTYNLRLMREQLDAAGVKYDFKAVFWRQSSGDQNSDWKQYGADQIRLFNALRAEVGVPDLPVIFEGDAYRTNIQAGKVYAAKVLCHATVGLALTTQQRPDSYDQCKLRIGDPCHEYKVFNGQMENQFGWDIGFPNEDKVPRPSGFSPELSKWVVRYGTVNGKAPNLHDEYDGMWWNGIAMANAYVREHTSITVPLAMTEWDLWAKWPGKRCTIEDPWSETNLCWEDPSAECVTAQEPARCSRVTADDCRTTERAYTKCPCACQELATCAAEPPVIDPATLTYYPDIVGPMTLATATFAVSARDNGDSTTTSTNTTGTNIVSGTSTIALSAVVCTAILMVL